MGFLQGGVCYSTYDEAMSVKFGADPVLITTATNGTDKLHFFENIAGVWHWSEYQTTGGVWTLAYNSTVTTIGFPVCTPSSTVFDPVLGGAFWSFAMTFVFGCWILSKNAGVVLNAFKRW